MTYAESARRRWGSFFYAWKKGWEGEDIGHRPSEYAEAAHKDGREEKRMATTGRNWESLGVRYV